MNKLPQYRIVYDDEMYERVDRLIETHGIRGLAAEINVTPAFIHQIYHRTKSPSPRILGLVGLRKYTGAYECVNDPLKEDDEWKKNGSIAPCSTEEFLEAIRRMDLPLQTFVNKVNWWSDKDYHAAMDGVELGRFTPKSPRGFN